MNYMHDLSTGRQFSEYVTENNNEMATHTI